MGNRSKRGPSRFNGRRSASKTERKELRKQPWYRDGFQSQIHADAHHWGYELCKYYVAQGETHPRYERAKAVLDLAFKK